ncbi:MAG TPA: ring-cleaving dioxygenase [bacterium]|nr:ring-cleaving dioxygenase [bacterium]
MTAGEGLGGIHHVTAIAGPPQENVDFYAGTLGLRLVKRTVNFDDPGTYHLYFGDDAGHPGTILTFFPWPGAPRGHQGAGQVTVVSFSVPPDSLGFWEERLRNHRVAFEARESPFDESLLEFSDPDGLPLELVADPRRDPGRPWPGAPVPAAQAIRGFHSVSLLEHAHHATERLLTEIMGCQFVQTVGHRRRYVTGEGGSAAYVDIVTAPDASPGQVAVGTVHHVAWRVRSGEAQAVWRQRLLEARVNVTPVRDRQYFHSIYYHEPGGVLFEIATDPPGFGIDEAPDALGTALRLPPWLEPRRAALEGRLPPLHLPGRAG